MNTIVKNTLISCLPVVLVACSSEDKPTKPNEEVSGSQTNLVINEFMADNDNTNADPDFEQFSDWIEIYNRGDGPVDMSGMYLTDDLSEPTQWQIPAPTTLESRKFLIFWADNEDVVDSALHTNFKLGASGEEIGLYASDGDTPIDTLGFSEQNTDISYGRFPDGSNTWKTFETPTQGASNN
jgi:hypothetical protein